MLQGRVVPHRPHVRLCGHLHAVLQGEGDGHTAQRRGVCGHRPGHRDAVWPCDYVGPQRGAVYGGPAAGPAGWSGFTCGEETFQAFVLAFVFHIFFPDALTKNTPLT